MNDTFFFYVGDYEFDNFIGDPVLRDDVYVKFLVETSEDKTGKSNQKTVSVIVVDGRELAEKGAVREYYDLCPEDFIDLGNKMCGYFKKLSRIAQEVYNEAHLGNWAPECVVVITHWKGAPVDQREKDLVAAVNTIPANNNPFQKWKTVASSSTRQDAFPKENNPFENNSAALPTAAICESLARHLRIAGEIKWLEVAETTNETELKKYYDRLMLKLNH